MASAKRVRLLARDTFFTAVCDDWPVEPVTDQSWWDARAEELLNYVREHKGSSRVNGQNVVEDRADVFNERVAAIISHMNAWHGLQLMQFHWEICCENDVTRKNAVRAENTKAELKFVCERSDDERFDTTFGTEDNETFYALVGDFGLPEHRFEIVSHVMYFKVSPVQYAGLRQIMFDVKSLSADDVDDAGTFKRFAEFVKVNELTVAV